MDDAAQSRHARSDARRERFRLAGQHWLGRRLERRLVEQRERGLLLQPALAGRNTPLPAMTSFFKWIDVCPNTGSHINFVADVSAPVTSHSDTTLVLYFFDESGTNISVATSSTLKKSSRTRLPLTKRGFRRARSASSSRQLRTWQRTSKTRSSTGQCRPTTCRVVPTRTSASSQEDFSSYTEGSLNAIEWTEEHANDWFVEPPYNWATLTNPAFRGEGSSLPVTSHFSRTYDLGTYAPGDTLNAKLLASSTFTDASSYGQMRLIFNDASQTTVESSGFIKELQRLVRESRGHSCGRDQREGASRGVSRRVRSVVALY